MQYTEDFQKAMDFYRNSSPQQKQHFLNLISDTLIFFDGDSEYKVDEECGVNFNGIYHQVNITNE
jgi:hypothetical protein